MQMRSTFTAAFFLALLLLALTINVDPAFSAGGGDGGDAEAAGVDPNFETGKVAVEMGEYARAIDLMKKVVAKNPENADALNYLGYSHRELDRLDEALSWYAKALGVDPNHKGANEYLGRLYLRLKDLPKAEERLGKLDKICFFGCAEYDSLKTAVADFMAGR